MLVSTAAAAGFCPEGGQKDIEKMGMPGKATVGNALDWDDLLRR